MNPGLVIRGQRVVTPEGLCPACVVISGGIIRSVANEAPAGFQVIDAGDSVVMPGLVDTHVHINQPGRTDWEGFETATRAAAAGGVTTLIDMPLNSIPATTSVAGLRAKIADAERHCWVDIGFWGGVVPGNEAELEPLLDAGVFGFKCFLAPSGVDEFPAVTERDLRAALPHLAARNAVLLAHAELPGPIEQAPQSGGPRRYSTWLESRPRGAEQQAIEMLIRLAREFRARVHIVHLSSADALGVLREARAKGAPVTVETCPHYLSLAAEEISEGATEFKCAPPIRERENRERLWGALAEGLIDMIVSDHSPCPPAMKCRDSGNFVAAWGGIASLELGLPVVWTEMRRRGLAVERLAEWMCGAPARLAGLGERKGAIAPGYDADLAIWSPEATFRVTPEALHHRHKLTPYAGQVLSGVVEKTFLRGEEATAGAPRGRILKREG